MIVLGKPYHNADSFLNMNLAGVLRRLGIPAIPSDLYPLRQEPVPSEVPWKYQSDMVRVARELADEPNLFPVMITFFGCGPDPFTLRHVKDAVKGKPLLVLEMDEHSSRAGIITRIEAFLDQVRNSARTRKPVIRQQASDEEEASASVPKAVAPTSLLDKALFLQAMPIEDRSRRPAQFRTSSHSPKPDVMYLPYLGDHTLALAAAARFFDVDARVLPPPDGESHRLGRPHAVAGSAILTS